MTTQAVQVVEQVASIHRSIFRAYEENESCYPIVSVERVAQSDSNEEVERVADQQFTVYVPTFDYDGAPVLGKSACFAEVPEAVKRGLMVWNECDLAVQTLFPSLQKQLSASLPVALVQWLSVDIARLRFPSTRCWRQHPGSFALCLPYHAA